MAGRNPVRFLAPIALLAVAFALYSVVQDAREPAGGNSASGTPAGATPTPKGKAKAKRSKRSSKPKTYTVRSGDTVSGIAERTKVSARTLGRLNPDLDPQTLSPGQKLKLR